MDLQIYSFFKSSEVLESKFDVVEHFNHYLLAITRFGKFDKNTAIA
jgi:hypothetical protein